MGAFKIGDLVEFIDMYLIPPDVVSEKLVFGKMPDSGQPRIFGIVRSVSIHQWEDVGVSLYEVYWFQERETRLTASINLKLVGSLEETDACD